MRKSILVAAAVCVRMCSYAQDSARASLLDQVVVTATRISQKQSTTGKVVSIITRKELDRYPGRSVTDILNTQAGMFINGANNNPGTNQDLYFRGSSTGNTLILVDGIPVGDPSQVNNSFDLNYIDPSQVERIEILRGAQSTLWGSDAVAGVINVITRNHGAGKPMANVGIHYGSFGTVRAQSGLAGAYGKLRYSLNYGFLGSRGISSAHDSSGIAGYDRDRFRQHNLQTKLSYQLTERFSISGMALASNYHADIDAGAFMDDRDFDTRNSSRIYSIGTLYRANKLSVHFTQTRNEAERALEDDSSYRNAYNIYAYGNYRGVSDITEAYAHFDAGRSLSLVAGIQYLQTRMRQRYESISSYGPFQTALGDTARINNLSGYVSAQYRFKGGVRMEAGIRTNQHSIYGNNITFSLNPSLEINPNTRVFFNLSSGFKAPSLYQLFSEYGNKDLLPETSHNYELGLHWQKGKNSFRLVGFHRKIRNLIIFFTDQNWVSQYINRDRQEDYGAEWESNLTLSPKLSWMATATYVTGKGISKGVKENNLFRRPNFLVHTQFLLTPLPKLSIAPALRWVSERLKGPYDPGPSKLPSYYTIDLLVNYQPKPGVTIFIDLRNLTDQAYFDIPGYNSKRFNFSTGINISLK